MTDGQEAGGRRGATVIQGGRPKAYRPLPEPERLAAFRRGLAAYDRCAWFDAHELLEPAWMGTADLPERDLTQGLIKLAAAHVHWQRGNPRGMRKNLAGARTRLAAAAEAGVDDHGLDLVALLADIDDRLDALDRLDGAGTADVDPAELRAAVDAIPIARRS